MWQKSGTEQTGLLLQGKINPMIFVLLLPIPEHKNEYAKEIYGANSRFEIEHYLDDDTTLNLLEKENPKQASKNVDKENFPGGFSVLQLSSGVKKEICIKSLT